jgi:hypothetical protein
VRHRIISLAGQEFTHNPAPWKLDILNKIWVKIRVTDARE